jgi:uncharacterized protein YecE (DUF72 family)
MLKNYKIICRHMYFIQEKMEWKIGCSGFHYKDWKTFFYPEGLPQRKWLNYYCSCYNTLELNSTFYKFPTAEGLARWYDQSCEGFRFSVKVPRLITHYKKFNECRTLMDDFYHAVDNGLREKAGCILFQLPATIIYSEETLDKICSYAAQGHRNVIEFRHKSWWNKSVMEKLRSSNIIFCNVSHPDLTDKMYFTSDVTYFRMHGIPNLYYSAYPENDIISIFTRLMKQGGLKEVYIYFNNTATCGAVDNSTFLQLLAEMEMAHDFTDLSMKKTKAGKEGKVNKDEGKAPAKKSSKKAVKVKYPAVRDLG